MSSITILASIATARPSAPIASGLISTSSASLSNAARTIALHQRARAVRRRPSRPMRREEAGEVDRLRGCRPPAAPATRAAPGSARAFASKATPPSRGAEQHRGGRGLVDRQRQVDAAPVVDRGLDVDPLDLLAVGPGLLGDEPLPEQRLGGVAHAARGGGELDPAGEPAAAGEDLRLHHEPLAALSARARASASSGVRARPPSGTRHPVAREDFLGLILRDVHRRSPVRAPR